MKPPRGYLALVVLGLLFVHPSPLQSQNPPNSNTLRSQYPRRDKDLNWGPDQQVPINFVLPANAPYSCITGMAVVPGQLTIACKRSVTSDFPWYVWAFLMVHEFGHVDQLVDRSHTWKSRNKEADADCYSASELARTDPEVLQAVIWYFRNVVKGNWGDSTHGNGYQMADWASQCAGSSFPRADAHVARRVPDTDPTPPDSDVPTPKADLDLPQSGPPYPAPATYGDIHYPDESFLTTFRSMLAIDELDETLEPEMSNSSPYYPQGILFNSKYHPCYYGLRTGDKARRPSCAIVYTSSREYAESSYSRLVHLLESSFPPNTGYTITKSPAEAPSNGAQTLGQLNLNKPPQQAHFVFSKDVDGNYRIGFTIFRPGSFSK